MTLSARTLYLSLAFCITLLFTATGIYYLITSSNQQQINQIAINQSEINQTQPTPIPTPSPSPTPSPEPSPSPETDPSSTDSQKLSNFLNEMEKTCYEPCEFSYQCPSNLECLTVNQVKVCANPRCDFDTTCTCTATPEPTLVETGIGGIEDQVQGLVSEDLDELDDFNEVAEIYDAEPTSTPTPTPSYTVSDLPEAGSLELTILVLLFGIGLSLVGFSWLKH